MAAGQAVLRVRIVGSTHCVCRPAHIRRRPERSAGTVTSDRVSGMRRTDTSTGDPIPRAATEHPRATTWRALGYLLLCVLAIVVMVTATGDTAVSTADPAMPAPAPGDRSGAATFDDLLRAPVPTLCQHDPGNLAGGHLPPQDGHPGDVGIALNYTTGAYKVAFGGLTGSGTGDAAMAIDCGAGGVPWPETVQLYTAGSTRDAAGPTRLGGVDLGDVNQGKSVTDLS